MSNIIRLFLKPRAIPGLIPVGARPWKMNANQSIQQQRMFVTDDPDEHSERQPEKEIKGSPFKQGTSSMENRLYRLEDNFMQVSKDVFGIYLKVAEVKGQIRTMKWQLGVLLALGLGGSGSILLYLLKKHFDEPKNEPPSKTEMQASIQEIRNILESMKATDLAKKSVPKA